MSHRSQGFTAAQQGLPESSCPHKIGTRARTEWRAGWHNFQQGKTISGGFPVYKAGAQASSPSRRTLNQTLFRN